MLHGSEALTVDFFEGPAPRGEAEEHVPPPWFEPPRDVVAALLPDRRVLARTDAVVLLLSHIDVYPTGCQMHLQVVGGRPPGMDQEEWWDMHDVMFDHRRRHRPRTAESLPDEVLRFGVQFADGTKATTTGWVPPPQGDEPAGPVLIGHGGGGGGGDRRVKMDHPLWLWPLPPPEMFDLVVEWPALGIDLTRAQIDGGALSAAAARAEPLFDWD